MQTHEVLQLSLRVKEIEPVPPGIQAEAVLRDLDPETLHGSQLPFRKGEILRAIQFVGEHPTLQLSGAVPQVHDLHPVSRSGIDHRFADGEAPDRPSRLESLIAGGAVFKAGAWPGADPLRRPDGVGSEGRQLRHIDQRPPGAQQGQALPFRGNGKVRVLLAEQQDVFAGQDRLLRQFPALLPALQAQPCQGNVFRAGIEKLHPVGEAVGSAGKGCPVMAHHLADEEAVVRLRRKRRLAHGQGLRLRRLFRRQRGRRRLRRNRGRFRRGRRFRSCPVRMEGSQRKEHGQEQYQNQRKSLHTGALSYSLLSFKTG